MVEKFHSELDELENDVVDMGYLARNMLEKSVTALEDQDIKLAEWVVSKKDTIAEYDFNIEKKALHLAHLYQPMAKDMRTLGAMLKIITYLTRIGRYGKGIAELVPELSKKPHISKLVSIPYMATIVCSMIDDVLQAFETEDISLIKDFEDRDDDVDALRYSVFRECVSYMTEDPKSITRCAHYIMIARYLERCADHACKIGEKVHYMVTGKHVEIG
ncbi:MAG: phosphate signaling complex protein PhoU [Candidatus Methanofastidiosia archaeon]|jgi:phosphate transport system protein